MTYYLQNHPNPNTPQYGWERAKLDSPGVHLSGVIGVHTSEAITDFEGIDNNAENNAAFLGRRTDYGSYHTTADADSIVPLVHPRYAAWADTTNNPHAMSVSGCLQAARWLEMTPERRRAVVVNMGVAAARMVLTAVADGYLAAPAPAVRISPSEAINGSRAGFYGHGETNPGTRYDPGAHFDWNLFLSAYAEAVGGISPQGTTEENDVGTVEGFTDKAMENLAVMVHTAVKQQLADVVKSVAFQERFSVAMLEKIAAQSGASIDTDAIAADIRAKLAEQIGK